MGRKIAWLPSRGSDVELTLGLAGLGATGASLLGVPGPSVVAGTGVFLAVALIVGVLATVASDGPPALRMMMTGVHGTPIKARAFSLRRLW